MKQRIFYNLEMAKEEGETRHPLIVIHELAEKQRFSLMRSRPFSSMSEGYEFWIASEGEVTFPKFITVLDWTEPPSVEE